MSKINLPNRVAPVYTQEGARAARIHPEQQLRRLTATTMLWEDNFYIDGKDVAQHIADLIPQCRTEFVAACAYEARTVMHLRHLPLLVVREMARHPQHKAVVGKLLPDIIQRADEITEFVAIYWKDGKQPLSAQVKKGLAASFQKFSAHQLAKYDRDGAVKLRDVAFLVHVKPWDNTDKEVTTKDRQYKTNGVITSVKKVARHALSTLAKLIGGTLPAAKTWENRLSAGEDKAATFRDLMKKKELGGLAFLRNIRKMQEEGIAISEMGEYAKVANFERVLPFRFIAAANIVPQAMQFLEPAMLTACAERPKLKGRTVILVDVSGSMSTSISAKSDLKRLDAANGLAMMMREVCEEAITITFSNRVCVVKPYRGFALAQEIQNSQYHGGTELFAALHAINKEPRLKHDRIIILTDEQASNHSRYARSGITQMPNPACDKGYVINVAAEKNGVGYGKWMHIDGWSEGVIDYIYEMEKQADEALPEVTPKAA